MGVFDVLSKVTGGGDDGSDATEATEDTDTDDSGTVADPDDLEPTDFREGAEMLSGRSDVPELDFTEASLADLDTIATGNHPVDDPIVYGSYLGETLVREFDGEWIREDGWVVAVDLGEDRTTVAVFDAARMALERGPVFEQVAERLHEQGDPYASSGDDQAVATEDETEASTADDGSEDNGEDDTIDDEDDATDDGDPATEEDRIGETVEDGTSDARASPDAASVDDADVADSLDHDAPIDEVDTDDTTNDDATIDATDEADEDRGRTTVDESVEPADVSADEEGSKEEDGDASDPAATDRHAVEQDAEGDEEDEGDDEPGTDLDVGSDATDDDEGTARTPTDSPDDTETVESDGDADDHALDEPAADETAAGDESAMEPEANSSEANAVGDERGAIAGYPEGPTDDDPAGNGDDSSVDRRADPLDDDRTSDEETEAEVDRTTPSDVRRSMTADDDSGPTSSTTTDGRIESGEATEDSPSDTADETTTDGTASDRSQETAPDGTAAEETRVGDPVAAEDADEESGKASIDGADGNDESEEEEATSPSIPGRSEYEAAAIQFTERWSDRPFDYSPASLAKLDSFLDDQWEGRFRPGSLDDSPTDPAESSGPLVQVGAYVGEVLCRHCDGEWVAGPDGEAAVSVHGRHGREETFPVFAATRRSLIHTARIAYEVDALAHRLDLDLSASGARETGFAIGEGGPGTAASSVDVITTILDRAEVFAESWPEYDLDYRPASLARLDNLIDREFDDAAFDEVTLGDWSDADALRLADRAAGISAYFAAVLVRHLDAQWEIDETVGLAVEGPAGETRVVPFQEAVKRLREGGGLMLRYDRVHDAVNLESRTSE